MRPRDSVGQSQRVQNPAQNSLIPDSVLAGQRCSSRQVQCRALSPGFDPRTLPRSERRPGARSCVVPGLTPELYPGQKAGQGQGRTLYPVFAPQTLPWSERRPGTVRCVASRV